MGEVYRATDTKLGRDVALKVLPAEMASSPERLAPLDVATLDAHNKFHLAESFGLAGDADRALDLLDQAVDTGFHPYPFMAEHCPFLAPLRPLPRFPAILAKARERSEAFRVGASEGGSAFSG
jgi:serine/threonine protein kinase